MTSLSRHNPAWKWYICALLCLATTINYMDRQTLSSSSARIIKEFDLTREQYGELELGFGLAFAVGTSLFGFVADRSSIRWLYPALLVLWSGMGICTGLAQTYAGLLWCRTLLGLFEAGHWPCALKTTQWLLSPKDRTMGNSILQGGTSLGAIATPLLMSAALTSELGSWRPVFQWIGLAGMGWVVLWLGSINVRDLPTAIAGDQDEPVDRHADNGGEQAAGEPEARFWQVIAGRRFAVLVVMAVGINTCWHIFRVWLPQYLQEALGYPESQALYFTSLYYGVTDVGCIAAGVATLWFSRRGLSVHRSRSRVFLIGSLLAALAVALPLVSNGWKLAVLLSIGFGTLGLFPCYYSFAQELSMRHQGKIAGMLGSCAWISSAITHKYLGRLIDTARANNFSVRGAYELGLVLAGLAPLASFLVLASFWDRSAEKRVAPAAGVLPMAAVPRMEAAPRDRT